MRYDRVFPLRESSCYPGSDTLDMVFFLPPTRGTPLRFWLMTESESPAVRIDDVSLRPVSIVAGPERWLDLGVSSDVGGGFGQLRIAGMSPAEARASYLVISTRLDLEFRGGIEETERELWGLTRADAGSTEISPSILTVGEPVTFKVRYTAGPSGLPPGAYLRFAVPLAFARPQVTEPDADGYVYLDAPQGRPAAVESTDVSEESHCVVDIICRLPHGLGAGQSVGITYRTSRTYLFPHRFCETDRPYWYVKLPPLSAAVAVDERKLFVSPADGAGHTVEFVPGPAERLHLLLPGRRKRGAGLTLTGVFTDQYRNAPPRGRVPADIELLLVGDDSGLSLGSPAGRFPMGVCFRTDTPSGHRFETPLPELAPGIYRASAVDRVTQAVVAASNPLEVLPLDSGEPEVYWGEIHGHCEMSDGLGGFREMYRHAREEGCLDFAASADHACYFSDNEWQWMQDVTNSCNDPGRFVTLIGYEWAGKGSHRNVYTSGDRLKLFRGMYEPTSHIRAVWEHFAGDESVAGGPHAPMAHGFDWEHHYHEPSVERFVEVYSMWGASDFEDSPLTPPFRPASPVTVNELLATGAHLGFTGGGDCHEGHCGFSCEHPALQGKIPHTFAARLTYRCGMTAALMDRLDRDSLIVALRNRKTYATTGARILLSFSVSGLEMGETGRADQARVLIRAHGCAPITRVDIVKDGRVVFTQDSDALDVSLEWTDPQAPEREHFYYARVMQEDNQMAWTSPVWVAPAAMSLPGERAAGR